MENKELWRAVLGEIEVSISKGNFATWFKNTEILMLTEEYIIIGVGSIFTKNQLSAKYYDLISETLRKVGCLVERIEFKVDETLRIKLTTKKEEMIDLNSAPVVQPINQTMTQSFNLSGELPAGSYQQGLNEKYIFDNFIVGSGNELAYAVCQAICTNPGTKYNPLFIYGGVGLGKTHMIQAVGNDILHRHPGSKVVYITFEQFVNEFLHGVRFKKASDFSNRYRNVDVLIVDDIQFITGKEKTQEEFFHTFNALHQANKQIIISSDKPPEAIATLEERLKSRFRMGMTVDIQAPDFETRCAILQSKAATMGIELPSDVVELVSEQVASNIRELEGALNKLIGYCEVHRVSPDLAIASSLFNIAKARPKHISARQVVEKTAKYYSVSVDELRSSKRDKDVVVPRQVAMYLLRSELHISFPKIAQELGRKDHTTAMHSVEKITKQIALDNDLKEQISGLKDKLYV